jgi:hypothetical protein
MCAQVRQPTKALVKGLAKELDIDVGQLG